MEVRDEGTPLEEPLFEMKSIDELERIVIKEDEPVKKEKVQEEKKEKVEKEEKEKSSVKSILIRILLCILVLISVTVFTVLGFFIAVDMFSYHDHYEERNERYIDDFFDDNR